MRMQSLMITILFSSNQCFLWYKVLHEKRRNIFPGMPRKHASKAFVCNYHLFINYFPKIISSMTNKVKWGLNWDTSCQILNRQALLYKSELNIFMWKEKRNPADNTVRTPGWHCQN